VECRSAFERLSAEIDGELSPAEAKRVRDHLQACESCARSRSVLVRTRQAFQSMAPRPARVASRRPWVGLTAGVVAVVATTTAGVIMLPSQDPNDSSGTRLTHVEAPVRFAALPSAAETAGEIALAADCLRPGAVDCRVDVPCADMQCAPVALTATYVMPDR